MKEKKYYCKTCNNLLDGKKRKFCNKDCQYEFYQKSGGFKKSMKKYMSKPENQEKNRQRGRDLAVKKKLENPRPDLYCQIKTCGKLIVNPRRTVYCSDECAEIAQEKNVKKFVKKHKKKRYCKVCGKLLVDNRSYFCSEECRKIGKEQDIQYQKNYWKRPENFKRKKERQRQKAIDRRAKRIKKIKQQLSGYKLIHDSEGEMKELSVQIKKLQKWQETEEKVKELKTLLKRLERRQEKGSYYRKTGDPEVKLPQAKRVPQPLPQKKGIWPSFLNQFRK